MIRARRSLLHTVVVVCTLPACDLVFGLEERPAEGETTPFDDIAHVAAHVEAILTSDTDWIVAELMIDTTLPPAELQALIGDGPIVATSPGDAGGPELLVIQARTIEVRGMLRATGLRPLVIVATESIYVPGLIDVTAQGAVPGAGADPDGIGAGGDGTGDPNPTGYDSGGAGASFGGSGAAGGPGGQVDNIVVPPSPGVLYGDPSLTALNGGARGGRGSPDCSRSRGGAGGGAIQLTSPAMELGGRILAGGGGGEGGLVLCIGMRTSSGGGGGSGGAIYLQARVLRGNGVLAANGGGGGSGASSGTSTDGAAGRNGMWAATGAAGGLGGSGAGGAGATGTAPAVAGMMDSNGGGGGGGVGRIYFDVPPTLGLPSGVISPPPNRAL